MSTTTKRPTLSKPEIVDAAMAFARSRGLAGLSMRVLADELGVSTMASYRHLPGGRDELVAAIAGRVVDEVMAIEPNATGSWKGWVRLLAERSRERIAAVPGLATVLLTRPFDDLTMHVWVDAFAAQALRRRPTSRDAGARRAEDGSDADAQAFARTLVWIVLASADASDEPGEWFPQAVEIAIAGFDA